MYTGVKPTSQLRSLPPRDPLAVPLPRFHVNMDPNQLSVNRVVQLLESALASNNADLVRITVEHVIALLKQDGVTLEKKTPPRLATAPPTPKPQTPKPLTSGEGSSTAAALASALASESASTTSESTGTAAGEETSLWTGTGHGRSGRIVDIQWEDLDVDVRDGRDGRNDENGDGRSSTSAVRPSAAQTPGNAHVWTDGIRQFPDASCNYHGRECVKCHARQFYGKSWGSNKYPGWSPVNAVCKGA